MRRTIENMSEPGPTAKPDDIATATLGGGCFWCLDAVFRHVGGVHGVVSGYAGGTADNPTYQAVCSGKTGHAEVVQVRFDPAVISYRVLLGIFFAVHDPTTKDRQGADVGTQYRSIVLADDDGQERIAWDVIAELQREDLWDAPIVTHVERISNFWPAEPYHQNFFANNPEQGYCSAVIAPKVAKFRKRFGRLLEQGVAASD